MYIVYSVEFFKNVFCSFFYWLKGSKQPLVLLHSVKTLTITLRFQVSFSTKIGVLLPYSGYFSQDKILLWNHNQLYYGKFSWVKFSRKQIWNSFIDIQQAWSKQASYSLYQRFSQQRSLSSCAVLWLWMHLLAACGLVSIVQVGWFARDRVHWQKQAKPRKRVGPWSFVTVFAEWLS